MKIVKNVFEMLLAIAACSAVILGGDIQRWVAANEGEYTSRLVTGALYLACGLLFVRYWREAKSEARDGTVLLVWAGTSFLVSAIQFAHLFWHFHSNI